MPSRPPIHPYTSSSTSTGVHGDQKAIPHQLYKFFANLTFHVVVAKLEDDLPRIYECIDELGGKCVRPEDAWVIITALKGRQRLLRSLEEKWIKTKPIVDVNYIFDTYQACLEHAVSPKTSTPKLPPRDDYLLHFLPKGNFPIKSSNTDSGHANISQPSAKRRKVNDGYVATYRDDMTPLKEDVRLEDIPSSCAQRPCPLVCINQDIVNAIKPIFEEREFEEAQQKNSNVLSYRRSLSMLKSVPRRITSGKEALRLQGVGEKVASRIDEFLQTGEIAESQEILASPRYNALQTFASVYTIGHFRAKELYERHHCRTLEDVKRYFADMEKDGEAKQGRGKDKRRMRGGMKEYEIVEEWMKLKNELDQKEEVEEIASCVLENLEAFIPNCEYTICGGYRRGKTQSSDVDIVFRPPKDDQDIGLLRALYLRLSELGIVTHVLHVTHRDPNQPIRAAAQNFDNLDKAFVIFKLPGKGRLHRRVDLISAPRDRYASAVLSWTGSMMFERDLKRYAENETGHKFRAGLIKIATGEEINLETEREIFDYLGLRYIPPELRNADG
uniref:DNA polymerase n=1 Tax=Cryptococcus bacillisporus CA1280 TaxID=1296109 RepID=A0A0D0VMM8_CRYGA|nr:DNA polymerase mu subunit [Cryptococcus bacillisporus CA1280]